MHDDIKTQDKILCPLVVQIPVKYLVQLENNGTLEVGREWRCSGLRSVKAGGLRQVCDCDCHHIKLHVHRDTGCIVIHAACQEHVVRFAIFSSPARPEDFYSFLF